MKNLKKDKKGMTLVELVIAMVLAGMLISIAAVALAVSFRLYSRSTALSEGGLLKSTLYSTISDELRYATLDTIDIGTETSTVNSVTYTSPLHGGNKVTMGLTDGYLTIGKSGPLSTAAYAGYVIDELTFEKGDTGDTIKVSYTIKNSLYDATGERLDIVVNILN